VFDFARSRGKLAAAPLIISKRCSPAIVSDPRSWHDEATVDVYVAPEPARNQILANWPAMDTADVHARTLPVRWHDLAALDRSDRRSCSLANSPAVSPAAAVAELNALESARQSRTQRPSAPVRPLSRMRLSKSKGGPGAHRVPGLGKSPALHGRTAPRAIARRSMRGSRRRGLGTFPLPRPSFPD